MSKSHHRHRHRNKKSNSSSSAINNNNNNPVIRSDLSADKKSATSSSSLSIAFNTDNRQRLDNRHCHDEEQQQQQLMMSQTEQSLSEMVLVTTNRPSSSVQSVVVEAADDRMFIGQGSAGGSPDSKNNNNTVAINNNNNNKSNNNDLDPFAKERQKRLLPSNTVSLNQHQQGSFEGRLEVQPAALLPPHQEEMCNTLIRDLNKYGVCVLDEFLGEERGHKVLSEVITMYSAGKFKDGQLVQPQSSSAKAKASEVRDLKHIRGDKITWIGGREPGCSNIGFLINQVGAALFT